uniref:Membrane-associated protein n=1 Tax=Caenorhabditis tropicalis TaxID=1561998 RepID=A0A1I7UMN5_9PELO
MGCLSSIEVPLSIVITIVFMANGLYSTAYKVIESNETVDENALDTRDMLMTALSIMSLIGICSSRRAFGVFTLVFMLHAFIFSSFHLFHLVILFIKSFDSPCSLLKASSPMNPSICHAVNTANLIFAVVSMIATALASMAVFIRLTTVTLQITDLREMATSRSFENSIPQLISRKAVESEREEDDVETQMPRRKYGQADIFV